jgi:hypothetical protein
MNAIITAKTIAVNQAPLLIYTYSLTLLYPLIKQLNQPHEPFKEKELG